MTESEERKMIHLGDITKINGAEIEPVDVITAGSPCQDLSVAGKRAGLDGERSGLFMEQIRIIKEMREHDRAGKGSDEYVRPRYMVWENVPGAFSSNKGEDFRCVLEETAKVAERDAVIPGPPKGKWSKSGAIMGDGWSIAWRVHDAQFWRVPQRRKRIALVADFGGSTAPEILFERKGLSGDITESGKEGKDAATDVRPGVEETSRALNNQSVCSFEPGAASRCGGHVYENVAGTIRANAGDNQQAVVQGADMYNGSLTGDIAATLNASSGDSPTHSGPSVVCLEGNGSRPSRRLTPLECERLQGFPDGWTDIGEWTDSKGKMRKCSDSARYKALGNSIALPFWFWLLRRISAQYERPATLGSLFDGIGGFPLCWERCNGKGTARWASEIEEFPIAVTKHWFG